MYHYVAISWDPSDVDAAFEVRRLGLLLARSGAKWDVSVSFDGMIVYSRESLDPGLRAYILPESGGVIFGRMFRHASPNHVVTAAELNANRIIRCRGNALLEEYWGSYVAFLCSKDENSIFVARDCSGRLPCYYFEHARMHIFFADIRDVELLGTRFTINPTYLTAYILHAPLHIRQTGLREVTSLLAGDCVSVSPKGASHRILWDPRTVAKGRTIEDYHQAREALRSATEQAVQLWASAYDRILLKLSGGLDSAIVLGCLKHMRQSDRVVCVTFYTASTDDDERAYARLAATMAGVPLIERPRCSDARLFVDKLQSLPAAPCPDVQKAMRALTLGDISEIACQFSCDSVWTGQGGDHVFLNLRTPYPAVDYVLQHRLPNRALTAIYESSLLSGQSYWSVLAKVCRYSWRPDTETPTPFDSSGASLMNAATIADLPETYAAIPWRDGAHQLPPGKQTQIDILADLLNRHTPLASMESPYECHPLISQPLLEVSLRIPTYHLLSGGRQRALAREIFADRLPTSILRREDKGTILDQVRALLRGSGALLRETLLDGTLVSLGIVDRACLERILVTQETYRAPEIFALLGCVAAEFWAKHWAHRSTAAGVT